MSPTEPFDFSVTFEFPTRLPETHKGTVQGGNPAIRAARAVRLAQKALRPRGYTSVVALVASTGVLDVQ